MPKTTDLQILPGDAVCGCDVHSTARKAVAVDPEIKAANLKRLRRIEGQIRGLQKMIEEDRYCADIVIQISSVQEALRESAVRSCAIIFDIAPPSLEGRRRAGNRDVRRIARARLQAFTLRIPCQVTAIYSKSYRQASSTRFAG
jgi:hypothetical protein